MIVLGIETSCDETAAALVTGKREIAANVVLSQLGEHRPYGGIVPEIAARSHLDHIDGLIRDAMHRADVGFSALDGIAVTGGPGLIGGLIVGVMTAKAIAAVLEKPLVNVNHLEAHALTCRLTDDVRFPYLLLLVTGGHCQLLIVEGVGRYARLGTTIDDAVGEAFDKTAKMLGLGYPGGPQVERAARQGDGARFDLPHPMKGRPGCDFSFSGLKTALRRRIDKLSPGPLKERDVADLCASFQDAVGAVLVDRTAHAIEAYRARHPACAARSAAIRRRGQSAAMARRPAARRPEDRTLVVAGGVAANGYLRKRLNDLAAREGFRLIAPPLALCTDNAAMVAWAGIERLRLGLTDALDFAPRPRWPLDPNARPALGAGVKA